jgi:hypothetical protein
MVAALVAAGSLAEEDSAIGAASPIVADSVVDLPAVEVAASQAVAFMAAVEASMEAVADSTGVAVVDFTAAVEAAFMAVVVDLTVAVGTAEATGN